MKTLLALSLALGIGLTATAQQAHAEKTGNGGGAWVCREKTGDLRWVKLVDFFEAQSEFGLTMSQLPGSYQDIVDQMQLRVFKVDKDLYSALSDYFDKIHDLQDNPPQIQYTQDTLEVINDSLYRLKPNVNQCAGGELVVDPNGGERMIPYEQVVNYKNDGNILLQSDLFNKLTAMQKAALVFHEAIYKYRRDTAGDTNSIATRRIVGLMFSTLSTDDLKKALADLGETEVDSIGMKFVAIEPGTFMMGSPSSEAGRDDDEKQHLVTLTHGFEIQATDVTQAQWVKVMGSNPSKFQSAQYCPKTFKQVNGVAMCPNNPVEQVSYNDVQIFISKLNSSHQDGHFYRLPTEAEWEYAARAGSGAAYFFGNDPSQLFQYAWFPWNSGNQTHEVAQLKPNAFGLYDMEGNVWQWVADYYGDYGPSDSNGAVVDPAGPAIGSYRVIRGGSWIDDAQLLRSAIRYYDNPDNRYSGVGFRLVRTQ